MKSRCTLVEISAIFCISNKAYSASALVGAFGVLTQNGINFWTNMLSSITFIYIFTRTPVAFKAILTAAVETLSRFNTGSQRFVAVVKALLAFIGGFTRFNSISGISLFTSTFVSTWYVHTFTVLMTTFISVLWKKGGKTRLCYSLRLW